MPIQSQEALEDVVGARFHARRIAALRPTITPELVAEHRSAPRGPHSDALQRVLNYFGLLPIDGKLITEHDGEQWFVSRLAAFPALRAERLAGPLPTQEQALHAVFQQRLEDVLGLPCPVPDA